MSLRDAFGAVSPSPPSLSGGAGETVYSDLIATLIPLADAVTTIASAISISVDQAALFAKPTPNFDEAYR